MQNAGGAGRVSSVVLFAGLVGLLASVPSVASAGTAQCLAFSDVGHRTDAEANAQGWLRFRAPGAELNDVVVAEQSRGAWRLHDAGHRVAIGAPGKRLRRCRRVMPATIEAPPTIWVNRLHADLGGGADKAQITLANTSLPLGLSIRGEAGGDQLRLNARTAALHENSGMSGGDGDDTLQVAWPRPPRHVVIATQGTPGHLTRVYEDRKLVVSGGSGNDHLEVTAGTVINRQLWTLPGDMPLRQLQLNGGAGNDVLEGNTGPDDLIGGTGDDRLVSRAGGQDWLFAGSGDDTIDLPDGLGKGAIVDCGPGIDTVRTVGPLAGVSVRNCEAQTGELR